MFQKKTKQNVQSELINAAFTNNPDPKSLKNQKGITCIFSI